MATITIDKTAIFNGVASITGYTGKNTENGIDRISVTEDERKVIEDFIARNVANLLFLASEYRPSLQGETITLNTPSNFNESALPLIKAGMEAYAMNKSCSDWFEVAGEAQKAATYLDKANERANNINLLLSWRKRPTAYGTYI